MLSVLFAAAFAVDAADCDLIQSFDNPQQINPVGDLDADGIADVAVTGVLTLNVYLSSQPGSPGFSTVSGYTDGGDLNGDGFDDLLVTLHLPSGDEEVRLYNGPFTPGVPPTLTAWWISATADRALVSGDHNGDGQMDVGYVETIGGGFSGWRAIPGQGLLSLQGEDALFLRAWRFHDTQNLNSFGNDFTTPAGDFDGDGRADVLFADSVGPVMIARGAESVMGVPRQGRTVLTTERTLQMVAGFDVQDDGYADVLGVSGSKVWLASGGLGWRLGTTYRLAQSSAVWRLPSAGRSVTYAGDRFGDGRKWMLVALNDGRHFFAPLPATAVRGGTRTLPLTDELTQNAADIWLLEYPAARPPVDVDGDGTDDVLLVTSLGACAL